MQQSSLQSPYAAFSRCTYSPHYLVSVPCHNGMVKLHVVQSKRVFINLCCILAQKAQVTWLWSQKEPVAEHWNPCEHFTTRTMKLSAVADETMWFPKEVLGDSASQFWYVLWTLCLFQVPATSPWSLHSSKPMETMRNGTVFQPGQREKYIECHWWQVYGSWPSQWFNHLFSPIFLYSSFSPYSFLSNLCWQEIISESTIENILGKNPSLVLTRETIGYKKLLLIFKQWCGTSYYYFSSVILPPSPFYRNTSLYLFIVSWFWFIVFLHCFPPFAKEREKNHKRKRQVGFHIKILQLNLFTEQFRNIHFPGLEHSGGLSGSDGCHSLPVLCCPYNVHIYDCLALGRVQTFPSTARAQWWTVLQR